MNTTTHTLVQKLWNYCSVLRDDGMSYGDYVEQLTYLLFLKMADERSLPPYNQTSIVPAAYAWPTLRVRDGDDLFDHYRHALEKLGQEKGTLGLIFAKAQNKFQDPAKLRRVIVDLIDAETWTVLGADVKGDAYEGLLEKNAQDTKSGAGQYFTPRALIQAMVDCIDPKPGERVCDPACGTGGFLACAIDHKRNRYVRNAADEAVLVASIYGVEKKTLPHMLCTTNMILHGIDTPTQIEHDNMLSRRAYTDYGEADRVNVIITNPPFGGMEEDGVENQFPATLRTRETADLFMALVIRLLKSHGRAAVVLPDGFLFGEGMKTRLKQTLLEQCHLHTIVRLPNGVFNPYTGIKTNILFFTKKPEAEWPATKEVWFYEHPYPEGVTSYNKTRPMQFEEFASECAWWGDEADGFAARVETPQAWKVSREDIAARNYNLDIKNPHVGEQISHDPEELLQQYRAQQQDIQSLRDQLKDILAAALERDA